MSIRPNEDRDWDIALIELDRPVGSLTGWHGYGYNPNDSFYETTTFYAPGYPDEPPYSGEQMYYSYGVYDDVLEHILYFVKLSYGGQSGSGSYYVSGSNRFVHGVLSHIKRRGILLKWNTGATRMTSDKFNSFRDIIAGNTPSTADLVALNVKLGPERIRAGDQLSSFSYVVHNYSGVTWSGTINVGIYLSTNDNISTSDEQIQVRQLTTTINPKSSVYVTATSTLPTIPADADGNYWVGIILDISDANSENNDTDGWDAAVISVDPVPSEVIITQPAGGEIWETGSTEQITWTSVNVTGNLKIELYKDGILETPISSSTSNDGS